MHYNVAIKYENLKQHINKKEYKEALSFLVLFLFAKSEVYIV